MLNRLSSASTFTSIPASTSTSAPLASPTTQASQTLTLHNTSDSIETLPTIDNRETAESPWEERDSSSTSSALLMDHTDPEKNDQTNNSSSDNLSFLNADSLAALNMAAWSGDAAAQCNMGKICEEGEGVDESYAPAVVWYRKAAEQGHADSQYALGLIYDEGEGVKQDYAKAVSWYRKAAEQGHAKAQCNLGWMYVHGRGVEIDHGKSVVLFKQSEKNNYRYAMLALASAYHQDRGVTKDTLLATYWFLKYGLEENSQSITLDSFYDSENSYSDIIQYIPEALITFPEFQKVKSFNYGYATFNKAGFAVVGDLIRSNSRLESLDFSNESIDDEDALILLQSLKFKTSLTELIFDSDDIEKNTIVQIRDLLAKNVDITELRQYMNIHPITRSDYLPLEVLTMMVDDLIVFSIRDGLSKDAKIAAIDELLLSSCRKTLEIEIKKTS